MRIVLLSGGSGRRLWPLSNEARSKQFLKLLKAPDGGYESMIQRVYRQIREAGLDAPLTIAASEAQQSTILSQLGDAVDLVLEPERRDTFPAIALSAVYLAMEQGCPMDEVVAVLPVDPYTELSYFRTVRQMEDAVRADAAELVLMGIRPTYPSVKYGYIVAAEGQKEAPYAVERFTEKPDEAEARRLVRSGAVWNGGVFAFRLGYLMGLLRGCFNPKSYEDAKARYAQLRKTSFDYEVVEKASSVAMIPYSGEWKDLGTWNTLTDILPDRCIGRVITGEKTENTHVINELDVPVVVLGIRDAVITASQDGILVSDRAASVQMKPYVDQIRQRPMFEERRWGTYKVVDSAGFPDGTRSLTKHLHLTPGKEISYQRHGQRDEIWTVVDGTGELIVDGRRTEVCRGDVTCIKAGMKHAIRAKTDLHLIEVQIGKELTEEDIERFGTAW